MNDNAEKRKQVEALLFSSGRSMAIDDIATITGIDKKEVRTALKALKEDYNSRDTSLMLIEEGDSWKLNIREQYVSLVTKIIADTELSRTVLETLGVVAWKAPVLQSEVIKIRSSQAYEHIKELVLLGFIKKEQEGRSFILKLSEKFFEYFDVPGDRGIKEALKEAKIPPEPEQDHLGKLEVYNRETQAKKEEELRLQLKQEKEELVARLEEKKKDIKVDKEFLSSMGDKITEASKRNDELDNDELFKRSTEQSDSQGQDSISSDTVSDSNEESVVLDDGSSNEDFDETDVDTIKPPSEDDKSEDDDSQGESQEENFLNEQPSDIDEKEDKNDVPSSML